MQITKILIAALAFASFSASAEIKTIELAYEIALSNMTVPVTSSGSLTFKECDDCDTLNVPMALGTVFMVNGETVEIREFRAAVLRVRDREAETIIVKRHLESNTITSLSAWL